LQQLPARLAVHHGQQQLHHELAARVALPEQLGQLGDGLVDLVLVEQQHRLGLRDPDRVGRELAPARKAGAS